MYTRQKNQKSRLGTWVRNNFGQADGGAGLLAQAAQAQAAGNYDMAQMLRQQAAVQYGAGPLAVSGTSSSGSGIDAQSLLSTGTALTGSILPGIFNLIGRKERPAAPTQPSQPSQPIIISQPAAKDNTMLFVAGGVGILVVMMVMAGMGLLVLKKS